MQGQGTKGPEWNSETIEKVTRIEFRGNWRRNEIPHSSKRGGYSIDYGIPYYRFTGISVLGDA